MQAQTSINPLNQINYSNWIESSSFNFKSYLSIIFKEKWFLSFGWKSISKWYSIFIHPIQRKIMISCDLANILTINRNFYSHFLFHFYTFSLLYCYLVGAALPATWKELCIPALKVSFPLGLSEVFLSPFQGLGFVGASSYVGGRHRLWGPNCDKAVSQTKLDVTEIQTRNPMKKRPTPL